MTGRLEGKVAFITGAARGQGRSHAIRLAQEGADIIAVDICKQIESNLYPLSTPEDLDETRRLVEALDRRIVARQGDVRERSQLSEIVAEGIGQLGRLDIVAANAGIMPMRMGETAKAMDFVDATDVDLLGVMNAVAVSIPHIADFGSIIVTGSTAGLMKGTTDNPVFGPGGAGYSWAKRTLVSYVEQMSLHLAPRFIRVNAIHPTNVNTHLLHNDELYKVFRPDLENPTLDDVLPAFVEWQAMPIPFIEPIDISNLVLFLASEEARYITGQQIRVDAGSLVKHANMMA
ncbi:mycofactocin-coupled SDR family oxidoreductase [Jatrophihabitans sp. DSM 45814]